jgi:dinuclear metal center YbgI/SA1388 family protein
MAMVTIQELLEKLEKWAPPLLQESYDNVGLLTGSKKDAIQGVLVTLDVTEEVVEEAIRHKCNLILAHHPIIFKGLKRLNGSNYVERVIIKTIKNDLAIYAMHTNLDHVEHGVNKKFAERLGLVNTSILRPLKDQLSKVKVFVPHTHLEEVREAMFRAGAGNIGNYSRCSFSTPGKGTFQAGEGANPFLGKINKLHQEKELKLEVIVPNYNLNEVLREMQQSHPYEEVAYDISALKNMHPKVGAGMIGELPEPISSEAFIQLLKTQMQTKCIRHTPLVKKEVNKIAICGGAGSFLISDAIQKQADIFITGDVKYHDFFNAEEDLIIADIGHYESEQFTRDLMVEFLKQNFSTFAIRKSEVETNPINYAF